MIDFSTIYVDLASTITAPQHVLDGNGAVICNISTGYGATDRQLTYDEFQKYLDFRCDSRDVTFLFKNSIDVDTLYDGSSFLSIHTSSTITMDTQNPKESYTFTINTATGGNIPMVRVRINNSNLIMNNMQLETTKKSILLFYGPFYQIDSSFNNLNIDNCRFWLKEPTAASITVNLLGATAETSATSVAFNTLKLVTCSNSIFNNKTDTVGTSVVVTPPWTGYGDGDGVGAIFQSNIFIRVYNFYETIQSKYDLVYREVVKFNIFTGDEEGFRNTPEDRYFYNIIQHADVSSYNTYGWNPIPLPPVWDNPLGGLTQDDFYYLSNGWGTINYDWIDELDDIESNAISLELAYGRRDGSGALLFHDTPNPFIFVNPTMGSIGDDVILTNADTTYDTVYEPFEYQWSFGDEYQTSTESLGEVTFTINDSGMIQTYMTIISHNRFYDVTTSTNVRSILDPNDIDVEIITQDYNGNTKDVFSVHEYVQIIITNKTNLEVDTIHTTQVIINNDSQVINIPGHNDMMTINKTFKSIQNVSIICKVTSIDGMTYYFSKEITIESISGNTYYVDLTKDYGDDKWLTLKYGLYDTFEDGAISSGFNSDFRSNYSVIHMYDEKVATGTTLATVINSIKYGDFIAKWSFVRNSEDDIPSMVFNIGSFELDIDWDFISNRITGRANDDLYGTTYGSYILDSNCPNSIHKIEFDLSYTKDDSQLILSYTLDDGNTGQLYTVTIDTFNNVSMKTQCGNGSGLGYIQLQAEEVDEVSFPTEGNGSQKYPFTYEEMYDRIRDGNYVGGLYDSYLCRGSRKVSQNNFVIDPTNHTYINVWDPHKYGPWVLIFDNMRTNIDFTGTILSNGIMYNIPSPSISNLRVTTLYDMLVTWNGQNNKVVFMRYTTQFMNNDVRSDIIGCTIKSEGGFLSDYFGGDA